MNILTQLGMRIRYLRKLKKWSQEELALESGVNKNYISDLERGLRNPTVIILDRLVTALGIDLETLFKGIKSYK